MNGIIRTGSIVIDGNPYSVNSPGVCKDVITDKYLNTNHGNTVRIITSISKVRNCRAGSKFQMADSDTWNYYAFGEGNIHEDVYTGLIDTHTGGFTYVHPNVLTIHTAYGGYIGLVCKEEDKEKIIKSIGFIPGINNPEAYYDPREIAIMDKPKPYRKFDNTFKKLTLDEVFSRKLTPEENGSAEVRDIYKNVLMQNISQGVESLTFKEFEGLRYTFGVELETCSGRFEPKEVEGLNVKAVHDGSLREPDGSNPVGGEYVTGVLIGDSGVNQLHEICRVLQTKCKVDKRCGVHVHVGTLNWNKEEVVFSYILGEMLETDLFSILPVSRRNSTYCRPIKKISKYYLSQLVNAKSTQDYQIKIDEMYTAIFKEVSGIHDNGMIAGSKSINRETNHPKGSKCQFDKASQRYCWLNYVTLLFNTKGVPNSHTLEFRPMSGTLNFTKVKNWLKICFAFCAFVENHKNLIKTSKDLNLEFMIDKIYPKTGKVLIDYIKERRQLFMTADESVDYVVDPNIKRKSIKEVVCA